MGDPAAFQEFMELDAKPFFAGRMEMYETHLHRAARTQVSTLLSNLSDLYVGAYDGIFQTQVESGDKEGFDAFTAAADTACARLADQPKLRQSHLELEVVYRSALTVRPRYNILCKKIAKATGGRFLPAPLKGLFRALEKSAMRMNPENRFNCDNVYDVVRGALVFIDMAGVQRGLEAVCDAFDVMRIKNRFLPTGQAGGSGGWRDVVINGRLKNDPTKHVLEVQIHLQCLLDVRKKLGGHFVYAIYRSLSEALEVCDGNCVDVVEAPRLGPDKIADANAKEMLKGTFNDGEGQVHNVEFVISEDAAALGWADSLDDSILTMGLTDASGNKYTCYFKKEVRDADAPLGLMREERHVMTHTLKKIFQVLRVL